MRTGSGTNVNNVVRSSHGIFIVFNYDKGIAKVSQVLKRVKELVIVPLMETDTGLIEDIAYSAKA